MNKLAVLTLAAFALSPALATTNVGVSIGIAQPGVYGRIDIGNMAPPRVTMVQQPVYLYVPPGHQKHWGRHCGEYHACGQPVYFVREDWVRDRYAEESRHGHGHDNGQKDSHGNKGGKHDHD